MSTISRKERLAAGAIGVILIALLINGYLHGADFQVFYTAGLRARSGLPIYRVDDGWFPFKYHPGWAAFFSAFTFLPVHVACVAFNVLMIWVWWIGARRWANWLKFPMTNQRWLVLLLLALSAFSAETGFGQANGILFTGLTFAISDLESEDPHPIRAGVLFALLIGLKLNFGLLLAYAVVRRPMSIAGLILGALGLHALVAAFYGQWLATDVYGSWLDILLTQSSTQYYIFESQGFLRFFHSLFGDAARILWGVTVALIFFGGFQLWRHRAGPPSVAAYWMAGAYLLSPLPWWYQILYMFPAAFYVWRRSDVGWERGLICFCLAVYALVTFNTLGRQGLIAFKDWQGFFVCSLILYLLFVRSTVFKKEVLV